MKTEVDSYSGDDDDDDYNEDVDGGDGVVSSGEVDDHDDVRSGGEYNGGDGDYEADVDEG